MAVSHPCGGQRVQGGRDGTATGGVYDVLQALANGLLGTFGREAQHHDHLLTSTYKTLNTLCRRAGVREWEILPYRFYATEMLLQSSGVFRLVVQAGQVVIRLVERIAPLRSFGYIVRIAL